MGEKEIPREDHCHADGVGTDTEPTTTRTTSFEARCMSTLAHCQSRD